MTEWDGRERRGATVSFLAGAHAAFARGAPFSRYVILDRLKTDGSLYLAFDPLLERKIELQLIDRAHLAAARRLASLSQRNVAHVTDVGEFAGRAFVASLHAPGPTLSRWLAISPPRREIIEVFRQTAQGLRALHAVGLVLGSFDPDRVTVGEDGEVQLRVDVAQCEGDPREDQFALCLAMEKALTDPLPRWLRQTVQRGLRVDPAERFASMDELIAALRERRSWRWAHRPWLAATLVVAAGILLWRREAIETALLCPSNDPGVWSAAHKQALLERFASTNVPYAADTARTVAARLDVYAAEWTRMRSDACAATRLQGEQSEAMLNLRIACLDDKLDEVRALGELFVSADAAIVEGSVRAVSSLSPIAQCADIEALHAPQPPPFEPSQRARIATLRAQLARAKALLDAGKYADGEREAAAIAVATTELNHRPLQAEALTLHGALLFESGRQPEAEAALFRGFRAAQGGRHDIEAARAAIRLVAVTMTRSDEALRWAGIASATLERIGPGVDPFLRAMLANNIGVVHAMHGRDAEAITQHREALAAVGADSLQSSRSLNNLCIALLHLSRFKEAEAAGLHALSIQEQLLGSEHPEVARTLHNLAVVAQKRGDHEQSLERFRRALAIKERTLPPGHPAVGRSLKGVADAELALGRDDDALEHGRRALQIVEKSLGDAHPHVAEIMGTVGDALLRRGDAAKAVEHYERAMSIYLRSFSGDHPSVVEVRDKLMRAKQRVRLGNRENGSRAPLARKRLS